MKTLPLFLPIVLATGPLVEAQTPLFSAEGQNAGDSFGYTLDGVGDVDRDGVPDFAIGTPQANVGGSDTGIAVVYSGADGSILHLWSGGADDDWFCQSIAGVGDLDGDGHADVAVGAPLMDVAAENGGSVFTYSGATGAVLWAWHGGVAGDQFGSCVAAAGDLDQDGYPDVAVGAPLATGVGPRTGYVRVFSGQGGQELLFLTGVAGGDEFGTSVGGPGDTDGDGFADLLVGSRYATGLETRSGVAALYSGADGSLLALFPGSRTDDQFGRSVAAAGDVDGDSIQDLLIGAFGSDVGGSGSGLAQLYSGADFTLLESWSGGAIDTAFGWSVAGAGDFDGDGVPDALIGANRDDGAGVNAGSAMVYSGLHGGLLHEFHGAGPGDYFGWAVAGAGDVDGDGFAEVLVGAPLFDGNSTWVGQATVFAGHDLFLSSSPLAIQTGETATLTVRGGTPGLLALLAVVELNDTPLFQTVPTLGLFDSLGEWSLTFPVRGNQAGVVAELQAFGEVLSGRIEESVALRLEIP